MSRLNRGRNLVYLAGVTLLGGRVISVTRKSHLHSRFWMATAMLEVSCTVLNSGANEISARTTSLDRQARHIHFAPLVREELQVASLACPLASFVLPALQWPKVQGWERVLVQA